MNSTAHFLEALGIDPNTVERVLFDHRVGDVPRVTVWHIPHRDQMNKAVSELTRVYELKGKSPND
jgi:hypothetical protein